MSLRIAQVATMGFPVPPRGYGSVEKVVHALTETLVDEDHDVLLIAAQGSASSARLHEVPGTPWAFNRVGESTHSLVDRMRVVRHIRNVLLRHIDELDIVHFHSAWMAEALQPSLPIPSVTTLHMQLDTAANRDMLGKWDAGPLVSVSDAQRQGVRDLDLPWLATVYNGLPLSETTWLGSGEGGYLAFLGMLSPVKDPASAMRAAIDADIPLRVAGPAPWYEGDYMREVLNPLLAHPLVEWIGEIGDAERGAFLGDAVGSVCTTPGPEPGSLAIIESLAFGTPVIGRHVGVPPEMVHDAIHGYLATTDGEREAACRALDRISRSTCRTWALQRFSQQRMAQDYVRVYETVLGGYLASRTAGGHQAASPRLR
nr:glycosyltransferase [Kibdelosporangium sp. MJ126-NF4]CEL13015.1 Glycosyltransferase [Kibdelosporangium sp. MJ126-NF4]CTQ98701.1 Glycosyltransferase [Kibdelosporangium sp. MJ126-NF4]